MNFMEAVKEMCNGKEVKRNCWRTTFLNDYGKLRYLEGTSGEYILDRSDFEATDWEIYEEDKELLEGVDIDGTMRTVVRGYKKDGINYITEIKRENIEEEKETLSDKITTRHEQHKMDDEIGKTTYLCYTEDVKEALKEFFAYLNEEHYISDFHPVITKAKKIFGDRLV